MTKPKVVFDPFSEDYFDNPFDIYRRMREEAPLYYDEKEDFYALTRHEDVAAAFKDFETYSSARGCDLAMVRKGVSPEQKSIIFMDPPEHRHMRSLLNKAFTPRAIRVMTSTGNGPEKSWTMSKRSGSAAPRYLSMTSMTVSRCD